MSDDKALKRRDLVEAINNVQLKLNEINARKRQLVRELARLDKPKQKGIPESVIVNAFI